MQEETLSLATVPRGALTITDYLALPEDSDRRYELDEGQLVMTPSAVPEHNSCGFEIGVALRAVITVGAKVLLETDVDLRLVPDGGPATVRRPDVLIVTKAAYERTRAAGGLLAADDVLLAVEVVSPSSRRTDRLVKLAEYADAGIPHYWIVDLDDGPSLTVCRLVDGRYEQAAYRGVATITEPFDVTIELASLV